jgi:hypothetical protein
MQDPAKVNLMLSSEEFKHAKIEVLSSLSQSLLSNDAEKDKDGN